MLDIRTIGILSALTPLVLGCIMLIYLKERKVYGGFKHWVLANFGLSAGYMVISLRDLPSPLFYLWIGDILIGYCIILIYEGIEHFYERPAFSRFNYLVLGLFIALQVYFTYLKPNVSARMGVSSLVIGILVLRAGERLFHVSIPKLGKTSRSAGYVFLVTALFPIVRVVDAFFASWSGHVFSQMLNSWFSVVFLISIVTWTFYFFFLNTARLELDLETARSELDLIARTDPLTNLYNRRHFDEQAEIEFLRVKRSGRTNSILYLDIDDFKMINDVNGHSVGDAVLLSLSAVLRSELRSFDLIARYGGDEFIIMLTDTNKEQAYSIAERIRKRVGLTPFVFGARIFTVTISAGITSLDARDTDLKLALKRSDDALYQAKQQGRNCVVILPR